MSDFVPEFQRLKALNVISSQTQRRTNAGQFAIQGQTPGVVQGHTRHCSENVMLSQPQRRSIWGGALTPPLPRPFTSFRVTLATHFRGS